MIFLFSKQTRATKVLMQMATPLLGFGGFPKLIEPRSIPLNKVHLPGWGSLHLLAFSFQKRDR